MKKAVRFSASAFFAVYILVFNGCKKDAEIPALTTTGISTITATSAETGGNVTSSGGEAVTARGVCWSTAHSPTLADNKTIDGTGSGAFASSITGLTPNTTYFVRAYAINSLGTAYGNEISFAAQIAVATLTTTAVTDITTASALSGGNITSNGGSVITDWGVCWSTSRNPTTDNNKRDVTGVTPGSGTFTGVLADLNQGTSYFVRAYAVNRAGTAYGNEISFSTLNTVTTSAIVSFTSTSAVVTGNVIYGQTGYHLIGSGVCWSISQNPTTADSKTPNTTYSGIFTTNLTGLTQGTTYFVRAYAEYESSPTIYGNELSFTTSFDPGTGTQKTDFPGGPRYDAVGFSISTKLYLGLGYGDPDVFMRDFWEWDQVTDIWKKKADFPGTLTDGAVGFSIGTKGYIETGTDYSNLHVSSEFWEYDPATDAWVEKSSIPAYFGRAYAVAFSIGTKGYIGTGNWYDGTAVSYYQDFWEWDQATNVWTQKADFPGNGRSSAVGFSIGNKGYIGTGMGIGSAYKDFWEWDKENNSWTQKADFAGMARLFAVGFSIGIKGYIGTGINYGSPPNSKKDFWEWDQSTDVWIQKANLAGDARSSAVGVSIGNKGYIATGGGPYSGLQDLWEYNP